jgi:hypothetical protein
MNINKLKIMTWDLTSNSLLYRGWRQNFGLYYPEEVHNLNYNQSYHQRIHIFKYINSLRLKNIVKYIKKYKPDILLLHGISNDKLLNLGEVIIQDYISKMLNFTIISTSYNNEIEKWDLPPFEQHIDTNNIKSLSGVATLLSNNIKCMIDKGIYTLNTNKAYNLKRLYFSDGEFTILNIDCEPSKLKEIIIELNTINIDTNKMIIVAKNKNNLSAISYGYTFNQLKVDLPILKSNINDNKNPERWKSYWKEQKYDKPNSLVHFSLNNHKNKYSSNISDTNHKILKDCYSFTGIFKPILITNLNILSPVYY